MTSCISPNAEARSFGARSTRSWIILITTVAAVFVVAPSAPAVALPPSGPITGIAWKCLDNKDAVLTDGNPIQLRTCDGSTQQRWWMPGDGTIRVQGNHCLSVKNAGTVSTTPVWLWDCNAGPAQVWTITAQGAIVNNNSGLCLADKGAGTTDGNPIWVYTCDGGPAQVWRVPASANDPSGEPLPAGDRPGWRQVFTDDFSTAVPRGSFPAAVSAKWDAYSGFKDTWGNGTHDPGKVVSVSAGLMNINLHTENGVHLVSAPVPKIAGHASAYDGLTYGRYAVRFCVDQPANLAGYKTAWLLWPDSEPGYPGGNWNRGEIDFPEGNLNGTIEAFMHYKGNPRTQDAYSTTARYGSWHTAVTEWTPQSVKFLLDGVTIGATTNTAVIPSTPMHWVLQTETTQTAPADSANGNVQVDWVAIWART